MGESLECIMVGCGRQLSVTREGRFIRFRCRLHGVICEVEQGVNNTGECVIEVLDHQGRMGRPDLERRC